MSETIDPSDPDALSRVLSPKHFARYIEQGADLLVHFAHAPKGMEAAQHRSTLEAAARQNKWSLLSIIAEEGVPFHTDAVIAYFDMLSDEAVFDDYDRVLFYGSGAAGSAAAGFALAAPGAQVLAIGPLAIAPQDRYMPNAENLAAAGAATFVSDPFDPRDTFAAPEGVARLRVRFAAPDLKARMRSLQVYGPLLSQAMNGSIDTLGFYRGLRARRDNKGYIRGLTKHLSESGAFARAAAVTGNFARRSGHPRFRKAYQSMIEDYGLQGFASLT